MAIRVIGSFSGEASLGANGGSYQLEFEPYQDGQAITGAEGRGELVIAFVTHIVSAGIGDMSVSFNGVSGVGSGLIAGSGANSGYKSRMFVWRNPSRPATIQPADRGLKVTTTGMVKWHITVARDFDVATLSPFQLQPEALLSVHKVTLADVYFRYRGFVAGYWGPQVQGDPLPTSVELLDLPTPLTNSNLRAWAGKTAANQTSGAPIQVGAELATASQGAMCGLVLGYINGAAEELEVSFQGPFVDGVPTPCTITIRGAMWAPYTYKFAVNDNGFGGVFNPPIPEVTKTAAGSEPVAATFTYTPSGPGVRVINAELQPTSDPYLYGILRGSVGFQVQVKPGVPPSISQQPTAVTVDAGENAYFAVTATGTPPLAYTWRVNGQAQPGTADPTFTMPAAAIGQNNSSVTVTVSNTLGSVLSSTAVLTVLPAVERIKFGPCYPKAGADAETALMRCAVWQDTNRLAIGLGLGAPTSEVTTSPSYLGIYSVPGVSESRPYLVLARTVSGDRVYMASSEHALQNLTEVFSDGSAVFDLPTWGNTVLTPSLPLRNLLPAELEEQAVFDSPVAGVPGWLILRMNATDPATLKPLLINDINSPLSMYRFSITRSSVPFPAIELRADSTGAVSAYGHISYNVYEDNKLLPQDFGPRL
jgi:hypothetical protein